jgi:NAD(P)-dependent dehydrogenase (short-subunit alcohol dehydrogenase family)
MQDFRQKVVTITGGGGGIGAALARAFAARGARLVLADLDEAAMARVAESVQGTETLCVRTDVGELASVQALADAAERRFGGTDVVCNNAGVALFGEMADASHADWEFTMRVNFWGVVHGVEVFVPRLLARGSGHVVNTASMAGLVGMQWLGIYAASKFAVVGLTESLHRELGPRGIGVSVVCPMVVETDINQNSVRMRPAQLKNPGAEPVVPPAGAIVGGVIPPDEVARRVLRAIERNDLYVLTHPEQRKYLRRRAERLDAMFEPDVW